MLVSKNINVIKQVKGRLESELKQPDLPKGRKYEVESAIYYLKEDLRYLKRGVKRNEIWETYKNHIKKNV